MLKLLVASLACASASKIGGSKLRPALDKSLALRGGLGGVEPTTAATWAARVFLANGVYTSIAPQAAMESYGIDGGSKISEAMMENSGYASLSMAVHALCLLAGVEGNAAFGWSMVVWLHCNLKNILNDTAGKLGMPAHGQYLLAAITAAGTYCAFTGSYMPLAMSLTAGWYALNGVVMAAAPAKAAELWEVKGSTAEDSMMMKGFGFQLLGQAVLIYSVASGVDTPVAVGRALIPLVVNIVDGLFISKGFADYPPAPAYIWAAMMAGFIGTTLF